MKTLKQVVMSDALNQQIEDAMNAIIGQLETSEEGRTETEGSDQGYLTLQELIDNLTSIDYTATNIVIALGGLVEIGQVEVIEVAASNGGSTTTFGLLE
jgi:hypothetical protein